MFLSSTIGLVRNAYRSATRSLFEKHGWPVKNIKLDIYYPSLFQVVMTAS